MQWIVYLFVLFSCIGMSSPQEKITFSVRPYFLLKQGIPFLAWAYREDEAAPSPRVSFSFEEQTIYDLPATKTDGIWWLQMPRFEAEHKGVTYKIPGMKKKLAIPRILEEGPTEFNAWFISDVHAKGKTMRQEDPGRLKYMVRLMTELREKGYPADAVGLLGDLCDKRNKGDCLPEMLRLLSPMGQSSLFIPVAGNHDQDNELNLALWNRYFLANPITETHFSATFGPVQLVGLNSTGFKDDKLKGDQLKMVRGLSFDKATLTVVLVHHPPDVSVRTNKKGEVKGLEDPNIILRDEFVPLLGRAQAFIAGDTHYSELYEEEACWFVTLGPAGGKVRFPHLFQYNEKSQYGVSRPTLTHLRAKGNEITLTTFDAYGELQWTLHRIADQR